MLSVVYVTAGDKRTADFRFHTVLIDEATQATEPESLISLVHGSQHVVFVGDHRQLGPIVTSKTAAKAGFAQSLFERLVALSVCPLKLTFQYRMHPFLAKFPSDMFYEGSLENGISVAERGLSKKLFPWPIVSKPFVFYFETGPEEVSASGISFLNPKEAQAVETVVTHLLKNGINPKRIGVITPYLGQRVHICFPRRDPEKLELHKDIEVASMNAFQAREKDFIIFSCVQIGFFSDPRRLNVTLTRARFGLIIIGHPKSLARNYLCCRLLQHWKDNKVLVQGRLSKLKTASVTIAQQPKQGNSAK
eukprot:jgi/Galph1/1271/GphlegSOOS_G5998.1